MVRRTGGGRSWGNRIIVALEKGRVPGNYFRRGYTRDSKDQGVADFRSELRRRLQLCCALALS